MHSTPQIPKLRKHPKGSVVVLDGRYIYCGPFGSPEAQEKYDRAIAEWLANGRRLPRPAPDTSLSVAALILAYWRHVETYYVKDGKPTSEQDTIRQALRFVRKLYGSVPAEDFGPLALKAVRQAMVVHPITRTIKMKNSDTGEVESQARVLRVGLARRFINKQIGRIKRMFSWAVENQLLPPAVHQALNQVRGLRMDRTSAREKKRIQPVSDADIDAVLPLVPPVIRTMIQVQLLCGGRPQDVIEMQPADIDRSGVVWEYRPGRHKNEHRERERVVFLGPRAQDLLAPYLRDILPGDFVFAPATRLVDGIKAVERGKSTVRDHYDAASYRRAIRRACVRAGIPIWFPLQLRHSAGTRIRKRYGLEASQAVLGHAGLEVTQIYAEVDRAKAAQVMKEIG